MDSMKLRHVVASLCALGLVSPLMAAGSHGQSSAMQARINAMESIINAPGNLDTADVAVWSHNHIKLSGQMNADAEWSSRTRGNGTASSSTDTGTNDANTTPNVSTAGPDSIGDESTNIIVHNANVRLDANVNSWTSATIDVEYMTQN